MAGDPALDSFLGRWLTIRKQDEAAAKPADALYRAIPTLLRDPEAAEFPARLSARMAAVVALADGIEREAPPTPDDSARGRWLRQSLRVARVWDPARWDVAGLELTRERNAMVLAAVSRGLEEAIGTGAAARQAIAHARSLRAAAEREFGEIPVPPSPQATWDASDYLLPAAAREAVAPLDRGQLAARTGDPGGAPFSEWDRLLRNIEAGWPVRRAAMAAALRPLADAPPEGSGLAAPLRMVMASIGAGPSRVPPADPAPSAGVVEPQAARRAAYRRLDDLVQELLGAPSPEARAFGQRLGGLATSPAAATPAGLNQELVGCLAFLDADDRPGPSGRWRAPVLERLARIAEALGGGEVLGDHLIGQPLSRWTALVTVGGYDDQAPPGAPRRITTVDQVGFVLAFADGTRKAVVRARVRIAP